jgi:Leucine-rich repeat (LRR) protein
MIPFLKDHYIHKVSLDELEPLLPVHGIPQFVYTSLSEETSTEANPVFTSCQDSYIPKEKGLNELEEEKSRNNFDFLSNLPKDIYAYIFNVDFLSLHSLALTSKTFKKFSEHDSFWNSHIKQLNILHIRGSYKETFANYCKKILFIAKECSAIYVKSPLKQPPSIKKFMHLKVALEARDTLKLWELLHFYLKKLPLSFNDDKKGIKVSKSVSFLITLDINTFKHISELCIPQKLLSTIPKELFLLKNLKVLNLSQNYIEKIPVNITVLTRLETLKLSNNRLKELPKYIKHLTSLTKLAVEHNYLFSITNITHLTNLQVLNISNNYISKLPRMLNSLTNLRELSIFNNPIKRIQEGVFNLPKLKILHLSHKQKSGQLTPFFNNTPGINLKKVKSKTDFPIKIVKSMDLENIQNS